MKNYRYFGDEAEVLGQRIDSARAALASSITPWSKNFWKQTIERLLFQWTQLPILHDGDALAEIIPRWTIDYNFYELGGSHENYGITDKFYDKLFKRDTELTASWNHHREARLARAQY
jgi:hypothetical protein